MDSLQHHQIDEPEDITTCEYILKLTMNSNNPKTLTCLI